MRNVFQLSVLMLACVAGTMTLAGCQCDNQKTSTTMPSTNQETPPTNGAFGQPVP